MRLGGRTSKNLNITQHDRYPCKRRKILWIPEEKPCDNIARRWPSIRKSRREFKKSPKPAGTLSWTSSFQNCDKINLLFKSPSLWYLVMAALTNWYTPFTKIFSKTDYSSETLKTIKFKIARICLFEKFASIFKNPFCPVIIKANEITGHINTI